MEDGSILLELENLILITDCIKSNGKLLLPRVSVMNLISSSSLDLEQILKILCVRDLNELIFLSSRTEEVQTDI